jgi:hypothetical protein
MIERYIKLFNEDDQIKEACPEGSNPRGGKCAKKDGSGYLKGKCDKGHIFDSMQNACVRMTEEYNDIVYYDVDDNEELYDYFDNLDPSYSDEEYDYYEIEEPEYDEECGDCESYGDEDCCLMQDDYENPEYEDSNYDEIYLDLDPYEEYDSEYELEEKTITKPGIPPKPKGGVYKLVRQVKSSGKNFIIRRKWKKISGHIDPKKRLQMKKVQKKLKFAGMTKKKKMLRKKRRALKIRKSRGL